MSRVRVIHRGRSFRCSPQVALAYIKNGAELDQSDKRGSDAYRDFMRNRTPPKKTKKRTHQGQGVTHASQEPTRWDRQDR